MLGLIVKGKNMVYDVRNEFWDGASAYLISKCPVALKKLPKYDGTFECPDGRLAKLIISSFCFVFEREERISQEVEKV